MRKKAGWALVALAVVFMALAACGKKETGKPPREVELSLEGIEQADKVYEPVVTATIFTAVAAGDVYAVEDFLAHGVDVNARNESGMGALHCAAAAGDVYMMEHLIARGADIDMMVDTVNRVFSTPVVYAAKAKHFDAAALLHDKGARYTLDIAASYGDLAMVKRMLEENPELLFDAPEATLRTVLNTAVVANQMEVTKFLVAEGAPLLLTDYEGKTVLHDAVSLGLKEMTQYLVKECGIPIDVPGVNGYTVLHWQAKTGDASGMIRFIVELGAKLDAQTSEGLMPIHLAVRENHKDVVETLLGLGADVNSRDGNKRTPIHYAIEEESIDMTEFLIAKGADVSAIDQMRDAPIHLAAATGKIELVECLRAHGADLMLPNRRSLMAIHIAAKNGYLPLVQYLVEHGVPADATAAEKTAPLHCAAEGGHDEVAAYLISKGAKVDQPNRHNRTPLFIALASGHRKLAEYLLSQGADIHVQDVYRQTPLFPAAGARHPLLVSLMYDDSVDVNQKDQYGRTALHSAAETGTANAVGFLIDKGAEVDVVDKKGITPLYLASPRGDLNIIQLFLDHGADPKVRAQDGSTPMHAAASNGHWGTIQLFLSKGANIDVENNAGETPLHVAVMNARKRLVEQLIERGANINAQTADGRTALDMVEAKLEEITAEQEEPGAEEPVKSAVKGASTLFEAYQGLATILRSMVARSVVDAAAARDIDKVQSILALYPYYVDAKKRFMTPLQSAVLNNDKPMVELLLTYGADPTITEREDRTAAQLAQDKGYTEIADLLTKYESALARAFRVQPKPPEPGAKDILAPVKVRKIKEYRIEKRKSIARAMLGGTVLTDDMAATPEDEMAILNATVSPVPEAPTAPAVAANVSTGLPAGVAPTIVPEDADLPESAEEPAAPALDDAGVPEGGTGIPAGLPVEVTVTTPIENAIPSEPVAEPAAPALDDAGVPEGGTGIPAGLPVEVTVTAPPEDAKPPEPVAEPVAPEPAEQPVNPTSTNETVAPAPDDTGVPEGGTGIPAGLPVEVTVTVPPPVAPAGE